MYAAPFSLWCYIFSSTHLLPTKVNQHLRQGHCQLATNYSQTPHTRFGGGKGWFNRIERSKLDWEISLWLRMSCRHKYDVLLRVLPLHCSWSNSHLLNLLCLFYKYIVQRKYIMQQSLHFEKITHLCALCCNKSKYISYFHSVLSIGEYNST